MPGRNPRLTRRAQQDLDDALSAAVDADQLKEVKRLLLAGARVKELLAEVVSGDMASLLIAHGAEVDETDAQGRTALHQAIAWHERERDLPAKERTLRALLGAGVDPTRVDRWKRTPIQMAIDYGNCGTLEIFARLLPGRVGEADRRRARENLLARSLKLGRRDEAHALIAAGVAVNVLDALDRQTPLGHAIDAGDWDMVEALLAVGADPNLPGRKAVPPLLQAAELHRWASAIRLVRAGADSNVQDRRGRTLWSHAREAGGMEVLARAGLKPPSAVPPPRQARRRQQTGFGRHQEPPSLRRLRQLRDRCRKEGLELDLIGLDLLDGQDYRYPCTPPDLLPFARTGGDGIHFGILTDFGTARALDRAPIVCVSPTNDPEIQLVAPNLPHFLAQVCRCQNAEALDSIPASKADESGWLAELRETRKEDDATTRQRRSAVVARLREAFNLPRVGSVVAQSLSARAAREAQVVVPTDDGLGVLPFRRPPRSHPGRLDPTDPELARDARHLTRFLATAEPEQLLALVRDVPTLELGLRSLDVLARALRRLGLKDESALLLSRD